MTDKASREDRLWARVSAIAALMGTVGAIVTVGANVSPQFRSVMLLTLIAISTSCIHIAFGEYYVSRIKAAYKNAKRRRLTLEYFSRFEAFAERVEQLFATDRSDSIASVLEDAKNLLGASMAGFPRLGHFGEVIGMFTQARRTLPRDSRHFFLLVGWLGSILYLYNEEFVRSPAIRLRAILSEGAASNVPEGCRQLREKYQNLKLGYLLFLEHYVEFSRDINRAFGERIAREYFEKPGDF